MQLAKGEQQVAKKRRKRGSINTSLKKYSGKGYSMATLRKVYKRDIDSFVCHSLERKTLGYQMKTIKFPKKVQKFMKNSIDQHLHFLFFYFLQS